MDIKYYTISLDKILISLENEGRLPKPDRTIMLHIFASGYEEGQG